MFPIAIALDLDGTLVDSSGTPLVDVEVLRMLRREVAPVVVVTGRHLGVLADLPAVVDWLANGTDAVYTDHGCAQLDLRSLTGSHLAEMPADFLARLAESGSKDWILSTTLGCVASTRRAALLFAKLYNVRASSAPVARAVAPIVGAVVFGDFDPTALAPVAQVEVLRPGLAAAVRPAPSCKRLALQEILRRPVRTGSPGEIVMVGDGRHDACVMAASGWSIAVEGSAKEAMREADVLLKGPLRDELLSLAHGALPSAAPRCSRPPIPSCSGHGSIGS